MPLFALAVVALGAALQYRDGLYQPAAIALLLASMALALVASFARLRGGWANPTIALGIAVQGMLLLSDFPGSHHRPIDPSLYRNKLALLVAIIDVAVFVILVGSNRVARWSAFGAIVCGHVIFGAWLLRFTPEPFIDVFVFQRDASGALLHGDNPYSLTFPDIYGGNDAGVYAPGVQQNARLNFGYPYLPGTLFVSTIGHALAGDYRVAYLVCVAIAASVIALLDRSKTSILAAILLLTTPRGFFIVEQGWCEPVQLVLSAFMILSVRRFPRAMPWIVGLLLTSKQYCVLLVLIIPQLFQGRARELWKPALVGVIAVVPFLLWNSHAFWWSAIRLQFAQPFRTDALSIPAWIVHLGGPQLPAWIAFAGALIVALASRRIDSIAARSAIVLLAFFALNKQAFANYYFLVIGLMCAAIVADGSRSGKAVTNLL